MVSDLDSQDLYPPDVEDEALTPAVREHRKRVVVGTALLVWGTSLLVQRALGVDLDTFWLGIGLAALAGWTQVPRYQWFVAGSIVTGLGVGELLSGPLDNAFGATLSLLAIAAGFAAVYVRYPRRSSWALPVAAVFSLIAVGALGIGLIGLVPAVLGRFMLPLLLIGGGCLLLARHSLPPKTVRLGLASLAVAFVLVGATSVPDIDPAPELEVDQIGPAGKSQPLQLGTGNTLSMVSDGSGDIEFRVGDVAMIESDGRRLHKGFGGGLENGTLVLGEDGPFGDDKSVDYVVTLPPGVLLDIERGSGSITGTLAGASGTIRTGSGDVELELVDGGDEGIAGDGPLDIETGSGSVTIDSQLPLDLDLGGEGDVVVNRENVNGRFRSPAGTVGIDLEVDAESGDIEIDMPRAGDAGSVTVPTIPPTPTAPPAPTVPPVPTGPSD